jgi:hypothetical protein
MSLRKSGEELFISKENQVRRKSRMIVPLRSHLECGCTFISHMYAIRHTRLCASVGIYIGRSEAGTERAGLGRAAIGCSQCGQNPPVSNHSLCFSLSLSAIRLLFFLQACLSPRPAPSPSISTGIKSEKAC